MNKALPYRPFVGGRGYWRVGFIGFLIRIRGIVVTAVLTLLTMGVPWWAEGKSWNTDYQISLGTIIGISCLLVTAYFLFALMYLRKRTIRSLDIKFRLHSYAHEIRDYMSDICELIARNKKLGKNKVDTHTRQLLAKVCEHTAEHFRLLLDDRTIDSAIRLASKDDDGNIAYKTYARSSGLSKDRQGTSEAIPRDGPTPRLFDDKALDQYGFSGSGVIVYDDVDYAVQCKCLSPTENFVKFKHEIKSMMVAPMNAWVEGTEKDMIGLLYVSSPKTRYFDGRHIDPMLHFADSSAAAVSCLFNFGKLSKEKRNGKSN